MYFEYIKSTIGQEKRDCEWYSVFIDNVIRNQATVNGSPEFALSQGTLTVSKLQVYGKEEKHGQ